MKSIEFYKIMKTNSMKTISLINKYDVNIRIEEVVFGSFQYFVKPQSYTQFKIRDALTKSLYDSLSGKNGFELSIDKVFFIYISGGTKTQQKLKSTKTQSPKCVYLKSQGLYS